MDCVRRALNDSDMMQYEELFAMKGFDDLEFMKNDLTAKELADALEQIGVKPGHALKFSKRIQKCPDAVHVMTELRATRERLRAQLCAAQLVPCKHAALGGGGKEADDQDGNEDAGVVAVPAAAPASASNCGETCAACMHNKNKTGRGRKRKCLMMLAGR